MSTAPAYPPPMMHEPMRLPPCEVVRVEVHVTPVVLCPGCRAEIPSYSTHTRGSVTVRWHRCGRCGLTGLRTRQTPDGLVRFDGWSKRPALAVASQSVPPVETR